MVSLVNYFVSFKGADQYSSHKFGSYVLAEISNSDIGDSKSSISDTSTSDIWFAKGYAEKLCNMNALLFAGLPPTLVYIYKQMGVLPCSIPRVKKTQLHVAYSWHSDPLKPTWTPCLHNCNNGIYSNA